jgi:hypothetical protein
MGRRDRDAVKEAAAAVVPAERDADEQVAIERDG